MLRFLAEVAKAVGPFVTGVLVLLVIYGQLGGEAFTFWLSAAAAVLPGLFLIMSRDIVRTAFWLLCSLTGFAGFYVLLGADFLALVQVTVYLGGIMILILFGVMLTAKDPTVSARIPRLNLIVPGLAASVLIFAGIGLPLLKMRWVQDTDARAAVSSAALAAPPDTTVYVIGRRLLTDYILPFEVASMLLLAALIGAAYIARRGALENSTGEAQAP